MKLISRLSHDPNPYAVSNPLLLACLAVTAINMVLSFFLDVRGLIAFPVALIFGFGFVVTILGVTIRRTILRGYVENFYHSHQRRYSQMSKDSLLLPQRIIAFWTILMSGYALWAIWLLTTRIR